MSRAFEREHVGLEPMTREHLDDVLTIERASYSSPWKREHFLAEMYANVVAEPRVLRVGERVVGYVCLWWVFDELQILNVAVSPEERRRGYARRMLRSVLGEARGRGCRTARLEVRASNQGARRLYEELGFVAEGTRGAYYADREDALLMRLSFGDDHGGAA